MALYVQYANSNNFRNFIYGTEDYIGLNNLLNIKWQDFYNQIFNVKTANATGLNIWGEILNTPRAYAIGTQDRTFGFTVDPGNTINYAQNFNHGTFTSGNVWSILPDGEYRCLLMLRARTFISNMSIRAITKLLNDFFINLQTYGTTGQNYNFIVGVAMDNSNLHQLNYTFKDLSDNPTGGLPQWLSYIFGLNNLASHSYYLPLPVGTIPNIIVTS